MTGKTTLGGGLETSLYRSCEADRTWPGWS